MANKDIPDKITDAIAATVAVCFIIPFGVLMVAVPLAILSIPFAVAIAIWKWALS